MTPDQSQAHFDSIIRSPFMWRRKAEQLRKVAVRTLKAAAKAQQGAQASHATSKTLSPEENHEFEEFELYEVGFFLLALGIENLLKALWVGKNYSKIKNIQDMRKQLKEMTNHDLIKIAQHAEFTLTRDDNEVLPALTESIAWTGRYPSPLTLTGHRDTLISGKGTNLFMTGNSLLSMELPIPAKIESLWARLVEEVEKIPPEHSV